MNVNIQLLVLKANNMCDIRSNL